MFGLGFTEILVILVVALLVFGPDKLPEIARTAGRTIGDLRRVLDEMKREFSISALSDLEPRERRLTTTPQPGTLQPGAPEPGVPEAPAAPDQSAAAAEAPQHTPETSEDK